MGWSKGGFSSKIHLRAEGGGKPPCLLVTARQRHEAVVFKQLLQGGSVKRPSGGRPKLRPKRMVADKGYSSKHIRKLLRKRGIRFTIPRKVNKCRRGPFDKTIYCNRNLVERCINKLKQYRRVATRYEKLAKNYLPGYASHRFYPPLALKTGPRVAKTDSSKQDAQLWNCVRPHLLLHRRHRTKLEHHIVSPHYSFV